MKLENYIFDKKGVHAMDYVCVLETKKISNKQVFQSKQEAIDFFESRYGEEIYQEARKQIKSIEKTIANVETTYQGTEKEDKKLAEARRKLERLKGILAKQPTTYESKSEPWKKLTYDEDQLMLKVGSIYKRSTGFEVVEEQHLIRMENISFDGDSKALIKSLPEEYKQSNQFLYILCGENASDRAMKLIIKLRGQLSRNYKKDTTRL